MPIVPFLLTVSDLTVDFVLGAMAMQKQDVSPILDLNVQYQFDNSVLAELSMFANNLEMSNLSVFLTKLHGTVKMSDESSIYAAQIPFSPFPNDPDAGQPFTPQHFVGRLNLMAIFNAEQLRWCIHPITMSALTFAYASGMDWDTAMNFVLGCTYGLDDQALRIMLSGFRKSYEAQRTPAQDEAMARIFQGLDAQGWYDASRTTVGWNFGMEG